MLDQINLERWHFDFRNHSFLNQSTDPSDVVDVLKFDSAKALLLHLAEKPEDKPRFQMKIDSSLQEDGLVNDWKKRRTYLKDLSHFPKYRSDLYDEYHDAARAVFNDSASMQQKNIFDGLVKEIESSLVIIPAGQLLFHGRANNDLHVQQPYPSFVSTTLNPVVAMNSALRRAGVNQANGRPVIYILTLSESLPALWGHCGGSCEWELLLSPCLAVNQKAVWNAHGYEIIEASMKNHE